MLAEWHSAGAKSTRTTIVFCVSGKFHDPHFPPFYLLKYFSEAGKIVSFGIIPSIENACLGNKDY